MLGRQVPRRPLVPAPLTIQDPSPDYLDTLPWELVCMILQRTPLATLLRFATIDRYYPYLEKCPLRLSAPTLTTVRWEEIRRFGNLRGLTNIVVSIPSLRVRDVLPMFANVPDVTIVDAPIDEFILADLVNAQERTTRYRIASRNITKWVMFDVVDPTTGKIPVLTSDSYIAYVLPEMATTKDRTLVNYISERYPAGLEVRWFVPYPSQPEEFSVIHPMAYRLFYAADLGLVNPALPPSATNPRLKDVLQLFHTWTIARYVGDLLRVFLYVVRINRLLGRPTSWPTFQTTFIPQALERERTTGINMAGWIQVAIDAVVSSDPIPDIHGFSSPIMAVGEDPDLETLATLEVPSIDVDLNFAVQQDANYIGAALAAYEKGGTIYLEDGTGVTF